MNMIVDYEGVCLLLAAVVKQARKDAGRDPLAIVFLESIGARLIVPTRTEDMRLGDALKQTEQLVKSSSEQAELALDICPYHKVEKSKQDANRQAALD